MLFFSFKLLYPKAFHCLESSTLVALHSGGSLPAKAIKPGMKLTGDRGQAVRVNDVSPVLHQRLMYQIATQSGARYTVTDKHRLTLRWRAPPQIRFKRVGPCTVANSTPTRLVMVLRWWDPTDLSAPRQCFWEVAAQSHSLVPSGLTLHCIEPEAEAEAEAELDDNETGVEDVGDVSDDRAVAVVSGSPSQLRAMATAYLSKRCPSALKLGQLIEVTAEELEARWQVWCMRDPSNALATGVRLVLSKHATCADPILRCHPIQRQRGEPDFNVTNIEIDPELMDDGREVEGARRFALGDGTLTHNCVRGNHETLNMNTVYGFQGEVNAKVDASWSVLTAPAERHTERRPMPAAASAAIDSRSLARMVLCPAAARLMPAASASRSVLTRMLLCCSCVPVCRSALSFSARRSIFSLLPRVCRRRFCVCTAGCSATTM